MDHDNKCCICCGEKNHSVIYKFTDLPRYKQIGENRDIVKCAGCSLVYCFPRNLEESMLDVYENNYWQDYRKNMEAVTPDDVLAVAQKYLHPDNLVFLVVGDPEAVQTGSDKHEDRFSDFGETTILPLRDPMTLDMK